VRERVDDEYAQCKFRDFTSPYTLRGKKRPRIKRDYCERHRPGALVNEIFILNLSEASSIAFRKLL
jgi:hypothetical protein